MKRNFTHIIPIGDVHGRQTWEWALNNKFIKNEFENTLFVFLGDYVDSYSVDNDVVIQNLNNIIQLKKDNPGNVILLLGNHDIQYLYSPNNGKYRCSGRRPEIEDTLAKIFQANKDLFQVCFKYDKMLFTHAGVSNWWLREVKNTLRMYNLEDDCSNIDEVLNNLHVSPYNYLLHMIGSSRQRDPCDMAPGGITWADKDETDKDFIPGFHQFVGHTRRPNIETFTMDGVEGSITYCDVLRDIDEELPEGIEGSPTDDGFDPLFHHIKL